MLHDQASWWMCVPHRDPRQVVPFLSDSFYLSVQGGHFKGIPLCGDFGMTRHGAQENT